jgi:hypothetical protein
LLLILVPSSVAPAGYCTGKRANATPLGHTAGVRRVTIAGKGRQLSKADVSRLCFTASGEAEALGQTVLHLHPHLIPR